MSEITTLLNAADGRGDCASDKLLPLVYDELRYLASQRLRRGAEGVTLQPTALVHEAWLRLMHQRGREWNDRNHFFRAAALAMRHILVDRARQKASLRRGRRPERVDLADLQLSAPEPDERVLIVNDALVRLEAEDPESARLVILKFFGGFTNQETAAVLGVSERTLERQWAYARASLYRLIQTSDEAGDGAAEPAKMR
jgi:hypothetical protein